MRSRVTSAAGDRHVAGLVEPGGRFAVIEVAQPTQSLAVGTFQAFVDDLIARGSASDVD